MRLRSKRHVLAAAGIALATATANPAYAGAEAANAAASQCQGTDMLAEFATKDPGLYAQVMEAARAQDNSEALLWKIQKTGGAVSYLFGTVHLSDPRVTKLSQKVQAALADAKGLAIEVADLSDAAMSKAMGDAAGLVVYTDGQTLTGKLTPDEYKQVQDIVTKSGMPGEFAAMLKPWIVNMLLSVSECERRQVATGAPVLDMLLAEEARKRSIPVTGLESIEQQLASLAGIPEDQQIQMLKSGLKYADRTDDMMETMVQLYLKRQIGAAVPFQLALAAKSGTPDTAFDGFQKSLLVDRNVRMREGIKALLDKGSTFVAVGALHLPGKTGLVALLKDAGYTLTPVE